MPSHHAGPLNYSRPDSWPPAACRSPPVLDEDVSTDEDEYDLPILKRNPLTYFLTPATPKDDELEFAFDFDAGIEDSTRPQEMVRSISPSTLDGLKRYKPRARGKGKGKDRECAILDDDDDSDEEEDYVRFGSPKGSPFSLPDFGIERPRPAGAAAQSKTTEAMLSPAAFHVGSPRGRPAKRFSPPPPRRAFPGRTRSFELQRRHSWREPSPDVWSIDEEPEKETMSELGLSTQDLLDQEKTQPINIPAAKPKKRVRFVLPVKE